MSEQRLVILVPTERDLQDTEAGAEWWPNFVHRVKDALRAERLDCAVIVCDKPELIRSLRA